MKIEKIYNFIFFMIDFVYRKGIIDKNIKTSYEILVDAYRFPEKYDDDTIIKSMEDVSNDMDYRKEDMKELKKLKYKYKKMKGK